MTTHNKKTYQKPSVRVIALDSECQIMLGGSDTIHMKKNEYVESESSVLSIFPDKWQEDAPAEKRSKF